MGCSEVDPVSGVPCLDTSGRVHSRHYGLGFDARGSWSVLWLGAEEVRRLMDELERRMSRPGNDAGGQG